MPLWPDLSFRRVVRLQLNIRVQLARWLSSDVFGLLVVTKSQVHRVAKLVVSRPFREFDLCDQRRSNPVRPLVGFRTRPKGALANLERTEPLHHAREFGPVEAVASMADVDERVVLIDTEKQRTEVHARLARLGPASNHKFLLVNDFQLAPIGRALARPVARIRMLGNNPFPSALDRSLVKRPSVAPHRFADAQQRRPCVAKQSLEFGAPVVEWPFAEIGYSFPQHIEGNEGGGTRRRAGRTSFRKVNPPLQMLKSCRLACEVERYDLSVENERVRS